MVIQSLNQNIWFAMGAGIVVYILDYYLMQYEVHLYHNYAREFLVLKGRYESSTILKRVKEKKWLPTFSFVTSLLVLSIGIYAGRWALIDQLELPNVFSFLMGGLLLYRVATSLIHYKNISLFRFTKQDDQFEGKLEYAERVTFTLPYLELYGFTALFLLLFVFHGGWFLPGGVLTCFLAARKHRDWVLVTT